jgi:hypothetical protein
LQTDPTPLAKRSGANAKVVVEKRMIVLYEAEAKIDGQQKELLIFPTGRVHEEPNDDDGDNDDDDDGHDTEDDD